MQGFITERDLAQADQEFPGVAQFFAALAVKPRTFLELIARYDHWCEAPAHEASRPRSSAVT